MTRPARFSKALPLVGGAVGGVDGQPEGNPPDPDCCGVGETPPDRAASENGGRAFTWAADVEAFDDVNLSDGTVTDGGGSIGAFTTPENANDGDPDTEAHRGIHVAGAGTHTLALKSDLGAPFEVVSHSLSGELFTGWGDTIVFQTSPDGNAPWTTIPSTSYVTGGTGDDETLVYTHDPETARYWRMLHSRTVGGLSSLGAVRIGTWAIQAETVVAVAWNVPAPLVVDGDDATYETITGTDLIRVDLGAAYRMVQTRIRIAATNAGARTFTIKGANLADFSDEATLTTIAFTATGGLTAQDVQGQWITSTSYRYWELSIGTSDTYRVHTWELRETTPGTIIVEDPTNGGAPDDLQDVLDNLAAEGASAHIADTSDAHDASAISIADAGGHFTGTDVEAALQELGDASGQSVTHHVVSTMHRFPVWGHRGDIGSDDSLPENTLESVRQCALKGAQGAEVDVRRSSAGTFYLMHDSTVDRTTNGSGAISGLSDATINGLTVNAGYGYISGSYTVPTLASVLDATIPYDFVLSVQLAASSDANATALATLIDAAGAGHRCVIEVSTLTEAAAVKAVSPALTVMVNNVVSGADADANVDWLSMEYDTIASLATVTGKAPQHVKSYISIDDFPANETTIIANMWARGVSAYQTADIDFALAAQRELLYAGVADHGGLDGLSDDDHTHYLNEARHALLAHDGIEGAGLITVDPGTPTVNVSGEDTIVTIVSDWGYDTDGPYYDDAGVTVGEEAALMYDPVTRQFTVVAYNEV